MKRALLALIGVSSTVALTGCIMVQAPDRDDERPAGASTIVCVGEALVLDGSDTAYRLEGDCVDVTVEGQDLSVVAESIDGVTVRGDRIAVAAEETDGDVTVEGTENTLSLVDADDVTVRGDRNAVTASGDLGLLEIAGNDNTVDVDGAIAAVKDDGDRNAVSADNTV